MRRQHKRTQIRSKAERDRGVATVDRTDASLAERLAAHEDALPCRAGTAPVTAAKTLHLLGESVHPLGPTGREVVRDWLAGDLPRTEAVELARATETEFALAAYVETHDPLPAARDAVEDALAVRGEADPLEEARPDAVDLL
ncbi:hypothetical protein BRD09_08390 [Halobacteriales archaeon SW_10_68_16]|nr:MAG: hypothetical protein BRD09_08390 [Halobacteriales archaeon SW_10_68_16]